MHYSTIPGTITAAPNQPCPHFSPAPAPAPAQHLQPTPVRALITICEGNGHFPSEAETLIGIPEDDEDAGRSQNADNGHVDTLYSFDRHLNGIGDIHAPHLETDGLVNLLPPPLIGSPSSSQWLDLNAPNVSPVTGAIIQSPTVPPLDLQSRLQQQQQHLGLGSPDNVFIRDLATSGGPVQPAANQNGSYFFTNPSYDGEVDSPDADTSSAFPPHWR